MLNFRQMLLKVRMHTERTQTMCQMIESQRPVLVQYRHVYYEIYEISENVCSRWKRISFFMPVVLIGLFTHKNRQVIYFAGDNAPMYVSAQINLPVKLLQLADFCFIIQIRVYLKIFKMFFRSIDIIHIPIFLQGIITII